MLLRLLTEALIKSFKDWKKREQEKIAEKQKREIPLEAYETNPDWRHLEDWFNQRMGQDINKLQMIDLRSAITKAANWSNILQQQSREKANVEIKEQDREVPFENSRWMVVVPKTPQAACKYGAGTRWCTTNPNTAEYYMKQDPLYIVYDKANTVIQPKTGERKPKRYQLHFRSGQFMDEADRRINVAEEFDNSLKKFFLKTVPAASGRYVEQFMTGELKQPFLNDAAANGDTIPNINVSGEDNVTVPEKMKAKKFTGYALGTHEQPYEFKSSKINTMQIVESTASMERSKVHTANIRTSIVSLANCTLNRVNIEDSTLVFRGSSEINRIEIGRGTKFENKENLSGLQSLRADNIEITRKNFLYGSEENTYYGCFFNERIVIQCGEQIYMQKCKIVGGGHLTSKAITLTGMTDIGKETTIEADRINISNAVFDLDATLTLKGTVIMSVEQKKSYDEGGTKIRVVGDIGVQNTGKYFKDRYH